MSIVYKDSKGTESDLSYLLGAQFTPRRIAYQSRPAAPHGRLTLVTTRASARNAPWTPACVEEPPRVVAV